jgi:hypothetical protein
MTLPLVFLGGIAVGAVLGVVGLAFLLCQGPTNGEQELRNERSSVI